MAQRTLKQQKEQKQGDLLNSAYQCFLTKGFAKTTIDDIVRRAQVAKGTFYLYFHDKEDIMKHLVIQISSQIVIRAYTKTKERNIPDFLPAVLCFIDTIIEYFKANKAVLKLIERNFSWPLVMEYLSEGNQEEITQILEELLNYPQLRRFDRDEGRSVPDDLHDCRAGRLSLLHLNHRGTAGADRSSEADVIPNGGENLDLKTG